MNNRVLLASLVSAAAMLSLSACSRNYAVEGGLAGAAVGAGVGAVSGGDVGTGAAVGGAAGATAGYFVDRDNGCSGYDSRGRLDDDCYGTQGYPVRPRN